MEKIHSSNIITYLVGSSELSATEDCCCYLVVDNYGSSILIDVGAGSLNSIKKLCDNIKTIQPLDQIKYILITHAHIDHVGGLKEIKTRYLTNACIIAHKYAAEIINTEDSIRSAANWYQTKLKSIDIDIEIIQPYDINLTGGGFKVIPTPGHTPGSVVGLLSVPDSKECIVFGQDIHGPFMPEWGSDISQWINSMQIILRYEPDYLCEGHFGIIRGKRNVKRFIRGYLGKFS
jgi:glyoxylase-like metal-dependent hydrolase (beta-lactamase superfamily II)